MIVMVIMGWCGDVMTMIVMVMVMVIRQAQLYSH